MRRLLKTDYFRLELIISCALYKSVSSQLSLQNNSLSIYRHKPTQLCLTPIRLPHPRASSWAPLVVQAPMGTNRPMPRLLTSITTATSILEPAVWTTTMGPIMKGVAMMVGITGPTTATRNAVATPTPPAPYPQLRPVADPRNAVMVGLPCYITMVPNTVATEKCIETVAALSCAKACEDDPNHESASTYPSLFLLYVS